MAKRSKYETRADRASRALTESENAILALCKALVECPHHTTYAALEAAMAVYRRDVSEFEDALGIRN